jgi:CubicO group peptidase (beta-lactamase class C family)
VVPRRKQIMSKHITTLALSLFASVLLVSAAGALSQPLPSTSNSDPKSQEKKRLERYERQVEELRTLLKIPGMSVAIVKDQKVLWAKGFCFADLENRVAVTPDTVFHLASITKTFAATLIMQLVEQGKLDLDEPMSRYSSDFKDDSVKIKHIISHTSRGTPGERFQYSGNRYGYLTKVIEQKHGKPFLNVIVETFFDPLGMSSSVPYHNVVADRDKWKASLGSDHLDRYRHNISRLSPGYTLYGDREIIQVPYPLPGYVGASAGLLSTVLDMAKYDAALDRHVFLKKETQEKAWTAFVSNSGKRLPYGLGWFVMDYHGLKLTWHTGHWGTGFSALYLKVPEKNVSLVLLANSEALVDHQYQIGQLMVDDVVNNVFASAFLRLFVFEDMQGRQLPDPKWTLDTGEFVNEITRLSKESAGYTYDCERTSQTALAKWRENRRAQARVAIQVDPKVLETYVGKYQFEIPPNHVHTISREGDRLFIDWPKDFKAELFAESESTFFFKVSPVQLKFIKNEKQATQLEFLTGGQTLQMKRIK